MNSAEQIDQHRAQRCTTSYHDAPHRNARRRYAGLRYSALRESTQRFN